MSSIDSRIRKDSFETIREMINHLYEEEERRDFSIHFPEFKHIVGKLYNKVEQKYKAGDIDLFTLFNYFDDITYSIGEMVTNWNTDLLKEIVAYLELDIVNFRKVIDNSNVLWEHISLNDIMYIKTYHLKRIYEENNIAYNTILD